MQEPPARRLLVFVGGLLFAKISIFLPKREIKKGQLRDNCFTNEIYL